MSRRGEGIYKRKDGRWEARYIHHYENGKAKYRFLYASTYTEVKAKRNAELAMPRVLTLPADKHSISFEQICDLWLDEITTNVKESTYTRYARNIHVYLLPLLHDKKISDLGIEYMKNIPKKLLETGGKNKGALSAKTVSDILCTLKSVIQYAKSNGYSWIDEKVITIPKQTKKPTEIIPEEHRKTIENILWHSDDTVSLGIILTLYTGIRIGELCGLLWKDIDFSSGIVRISRTVERISDLAPGAKRKTKVIITEPKTGNSYREIPLPKFMIEHLEKHRNMQDIYIITGTTHHTEPHQFYLRYKTFLRHAGVPEYTFHALRHTFATRCVECGFDTKSLSEILGHSNIGTTLSLYVHPTLEQKRKQMDRLSPWD